MGAICAAIALAEGLGSAALGVYDVVQDPGSGLMGVMIDLMRSRGQGGSFKKAAEHRRGMSSAEVNKLGDIKVNMDKIRDIQDAVCRP